MRTALATAAGTGAALALLLAVRRQRATEYGLQLQEETIADVRHDSAEKRITELQTKAIDQLGSDKAAVRLGGLYALERLAQNSPDHRQTIVNILCAYLRMSVPTATGTNGRRPHQRRVVAGRQRIGAAGSLRDSNTCEEWQVRQAVQQVLKLHLQDPGPKPSGLGGANNAKFWSDIQLDLSGATLLDFDLAGCRVGEAVFSKTTFLGQAWFVDATFTDRAMFDNATFIGEANFVDTTFAHNTFFYQAVFQGNCHFAGAAFDGLAFFEEATFRFHPRFWGTRFKQHPMGLVNVNRDKPGTPPKWSPEGWKGDDDKLEVVSVRRLPVLTEEEKGNG